MIMSRFPGGATVLMAVYGRDDPVLFGAAMNSVIESEAAYDDFVLVVDGALPSALESVISSCACNLKFRTVRLECNVGLARALNAGLRVVETAWVLRADADDLNDMSRFSVQASVASRPDAPDVFGTWIVEVSPEGREIGVRETPVGHARIVEFARIRNPMNHMTVAYRTELVRQCNGYPTLHLREDYGLWIRCISAGARFDNIPQCLVRATAGAGMYLRRGGWRYARGELDLQASLVDAGLKTRRRAVVDGLLRASVFLAPAWLRMQVYQRRLRAGLGDDSRVLRYK
jgi:hypothetical protein